MTELPVIAQSVSFMAIKEVWQQPDSSSKKGKHYSSHMANDHSAGTSGGIVFRAAEAMLIYMEASYEKNGRIDGTADGYWKALRRRAKWTKTIIRQSLQHR